eukprot:TRINITY_DN4803_c0_g2_i1.p1 TRINITY_DN4803_c0_g2~~TRINITY_DN4803_c0_g2_i1.p1  ORF type:complete len:115 (-),score=17.59 TRINITY_DN4803_c0_g2_i1:330-674(-)
MKPDRPWSYIMSTIAGHGLPHRYWLIAVVRGELAELLLGEVCSGNRIGNTFCGTNLGDLLGGRIFGHSSYTFFIIHSVLDGNVGGSFAAQSLSTNKIRVIRLIKLELTTDDTGK